MSKWLNQVLSKMWSPRQDEYTKLKTALKELEHQLDVEIRHNVLNSYLLENYRKVFKRIQEGRNHLSPNDVGRLQPRIIEFLNRFKNYGFEEIPITTEQPQDGVSRRPHLVVASYGNWSKPSTSKKREDIEMKTVTNQFRYENEPRRQSKRNNETPKVHQGVPKQIPPGMSYHQKRPNMMRGGYKRENVEEQKQKITKDVNLHDVRDTEVQIRPSMMRGGYKREDVEEQKQKITKDVNLHDVRDTEVQIRPSMMRGGYKPEDVEEQKQKITKDGNFYDVQDIEAEMLQRAQSEGEKNSNLQSTKHENRNTDDRIMTRQLARQRLEQENTKHVETRNVNQITTRPQYKEDQNRSYQPQDEENMRQDVTYRQKCVRDENDRGNLDRRQEEVVNRRSYSDDKHVKMTQEHVEPQHNYQAVTASSKLNTQYQQHRNEHVPQEMRRRCSDPKRHVEPQSICHGVSTRQKHLQHLQDQNHNKHQGNEERASENENRRSYNDSKEYTDTRQKDIQYQQEQYYDEKTVEEIRRYNHSKHAQKQIQHQQDQYEFKRQNNEIQAFEEKKRSDYNASKEYAEHQNVHHGVATRQCQQQQYYNEKLIEEENRRRYGHPEKKLEAQNISQEINTRQSHIHYQQDQNKYHEENKGLYYENYDRKHKPNSWGDSHFTNPYPEEYYIQSARDDGIYDRYREAAVQTNPPYQVRGRGRTHNLPTNYQHVEIETAKEVEEPLEILDVHQYFQDDFDLKTLDSSIDTLTQIETVEKWSKTFEDKVKNFSEAKFSLEYFVIDEKLMRMIEHLDKLKCKDDSESTKRKIQVIEYIKDLQTTLDKHAIDE